MPVGGKPKLSAWITPFKDIRCPTVPDIGFEFKVEVVVAGMIAIAGVTLAGIKAVVPRICGLHRISPARKLNGKILKISVAVQHISSRVQRAAVIRESHVSRWARRRTRGRRRCTHLSR